jgi:hypothetical protein
MPSKTWKIEGPIYPIKVRFVSHKTIKKANTLEKGEDIRGCFFPNQNLILVSTQISAEEQLHVLAHELIHACEFQLSGQEEETRVDTMARFLLSYAKISNVRQFPWL